MIEETADRTATRDELDGLDHWTISESAMYLGVAKNTVYRYIAKGTLAKPVGSVTIGKGRYQLLLASDVKRYERERGSRFKKMVCPHCGGELY